MADSRRKYFVDRCLSKTVVLLVGIGLGVALHGPAMAQPCPTQPNVTANAPPLTTGERQDIMDLIHNYSWTFDEDKDAAAFSALFTATAVFTACSGKPAGVIFTTNTPADLEQTVQDQISELGKLGAQIRHFSTNTILYSPHVTAHNEKAVLEKTMMLVTIRPVNEPIPLVDYTAVVVGEIVQTLNDKGEPSEWKFSRRTVIMDMPRFVAYAR